MTRLAFLNFFVLQWFTLRLARVVDCQSSREIGWRLLAGVLPLSGWFGTRFRRLW